MTLLLDEDRVRAVLDLDALIPVMERALVDFSAGRVSQPVRSVVALEEHGGFFAAMPAAYGDVAGAKLVTFHPENAARGLPTHHATIHLFKASTGEPLVVMAATLITALRTAAVSAVATRLLARPDARVLAILGSGAQARAHARALARVRRFEKIRVWSRNADHARRFAGEIGAAAMTAEAAVAGADVVVTATNAVEPILRGRWLKKRAFVNAVGSVGPARRELDDDAMAGIVIVDSRAAAARESGDVILSGAAIHAELGELLAGTARVPDGATTVFKSLGLAVEDIAAAALVYRRVVEAGRA
jgi:ornithine cyclodeaminase/alanine dehydrogenase-like protein (mu-crystallin family)